MSRRGFSARALRRLPFLAVLIGLSACSSESSSPEGQIRALFANAELAIEGRDIKPVKEIISENYLDSRGRDKNALKGVLAAHFLSNRSIHLLTRISEVVIEADDTARAVLFVAMTGFPVERPEALRRLTGNLYRMEFELVTDGDEWKVTSLNERHADVADFVGP